MGAFAMSGTCVKFVPGGCTGVTQPLDVGIMSPFKQHVRRQNAERLDEIFTINTAKERRADMFRLSMNAINAITSRLNSFHKAGPFIPFGPPFAPESIVQHQHDTAVPINHQGR